MILLSKYTFLNITFFSFQFLQIFEEFARIGKRVSGMEMVYSWLIHNKTSVGAGHCSCANGGFGVGVIKRVRYLLVGAGTTAVPTY